jgi:hypothetical protein
MELCRGCNAKGRVDVGRGEVPSNLILARMGARVWIARIMITWGRAQPSV